MKYLICFCVLASCATRINDKSSSAINEITKADLAMSDLATLEGFNTALLQFADDKVVKPQDNHFSVIGKQSLEQNYNGRPGTKTITWFPYKVEAAKSGDLGYSLGHWTMVVKDSFLYGDYVTIWKKQADGKWKYVMDTGNGTPKPVK